MDAVMNLINTIVAYVFSLIDTVTGRVKKAAQGTEAEAYVDTGVKILIAVVIGALLLAGLYALFNTTIMPTVTLVTILFLFLKSMFIPAV